MRARSTWMLVGGFVLFIVAFQLLEGVVGPAKPEKAAFFEAAGEGQQPIPIEVTRAGEFLVQIEFGSSRQRISVGVDDGWGDENDLLFDCIKEGIAQLDPELTGHVPENWLDRRSHEKALSNAISGVTQSCFTRIERRPGPSQPTPPDAP